MSAWMSGAIASRDGVLDPAHLVGELLVAPGAAAEQEEERLAVVGHPVEVGGRSPARPGPAAWPALAVALAMASEQPGALLVEQGEVELALGGEVLVEHGLGDAGGLGHLVHRRGVEAVAGEHLERDVEQLLAAGGGGEALSHGYPSVT